MCKKIKYDKIGARLALAACRNNKKGKRIERRYYFCIKCHGYHLTSEVKRPKNKNSVLKQANAEDMPGRARDSVIKSGKIRNKVKQS